MQRLSVTVSDGGRETTFQWKDGPVLIGSGTLCDLMLDFPFVSQSHGLVRFGDGIVSYSDLGSKNGTTISGQKVPPNTPVPIQIGADVKIGPLRLAFVLLSGDCASTADQPGDSDDDQRYFAAEDESIERNQFAAQAERRGETVTLEAVTSPAPVAVPIAPPIPAPLKVPPFRPFTRLLKSLVMLPADKVALLPTVGGPPAGMNVEVERRREDNRGADPSYAAFAGFTRRVALPKGGSEGGLGNSLHRIARGLSAYDARVFSSLVALAELAAETFAAIKGIDVQFAAGSQGAAAVGRDALALLERLTDDPESVRSELRALRLRLALSLAQQAALPKGRTGDPPISRPTSAKLTLLDAPVNSVKDIGLAFPEVSIGRAPDNLVCLDHPSVSRYHAKIIRHGHDWTISDVKSRNGITVNGVAATSALLCDGDVVKVGELLLRFTVVTDGTT